MATAAPAFQGTRVACYPWYPNRTLFPPDTLEKIYHHLHLDGLYREVMHERELPKDEFLAFVGAYPHTILTIVVDLETGKYPAVAWITDIARTDTILRGVAAFACFREFWDRKLTKECGIRTLNNWFNDIGFDLIYGMTPKPNRLSRIFCTGLGFSYVADLPGFTCYQGKTVDGLICTLTKEEFNRKHEGFLNG